MNINDKVNLKDIVFIAILQIFFFLVCVFLSLSILDYSRAQRSESLQLLVSYESAMNVADIKLFSFLAFCPVLRFL